MASRGEKRKGGANTPSVESELIGVKDELKRVHDAYENVQRECAAAKKSLKDLTKELDSVRETHAKELNDLRTLLVASTDSVNKATLEAQELRNRVEMLDGVSARQAAELSAAKEQINQLESARKSANAQWPALASTKPSTHVEVEERRDYSSVASLLGFASFDDAKGKALKPRKDTTLVVSWRPKTQAILEESDIWRILATVKDQDQIKMERKRTYMVYLFTTGVAQRVEVETALAANKRAKRVLSVRCWEQLKQPLSKTQPQPYKPQEQPNKPQEQPNKPQEQPNKPQEQPTKLQDKGKQPADPENPRDLTVAHDANSPTPRGAKAQTPNSPNSPSRVSPRRSDSFRLSNSPRRYLDVSQVQDIFAAHVCGHRDGILVMAEERRTAAIRLHKYDCKIFREELRQAEHLLNN